MAKPAAQERHANMQLGDGFVTKQFIGKGMFAWVYNALTPQGERVAVKIPHRLDRQAKLRFLREIKVMRELPANPHCVGYRGAGELADGTPWLAMEYVDGFTLRSVTLKEKAISERASCALMFQLCEGFAGLHRLGLAHRDIKPDNIMITNKDRQVKLMDFGLVQDSQGLLKLFEDEDIVQGSDFGIDLDDGMIAGTPEFMAPEQISDPSLDAKSKRKTDTTADVYSLAVIFYQLLTGTKPFPFLPTSRKAAAYQKEVMVYLDARLTQQDGDLKRPKEINPELWSIVDKALRRNPKARQGDARELGQDLEHYMVTGEGIREDDVEQTVALDIANIPELAALARQVDEGGYGVLTQVVVPPKPAPPAAPRSANVSEQRQGSVRRNITSAPAAASAPRPSIATLEPGSGARISSGARAKGLTRAPDPHLVSTTEGLDQEIVATAMRASPYMPQVAQPPGKPPARMPWVPIVIVTSLIVIAGIVAFLAFGK